MKECRLPIWYRPPSSTGSKAYVLLSGRCGRACCSVRVWMDDPNPDSVVVVSGSRSHARRPRFLDSRRVRTQLLELCSRDWWTELITPRSHSSTRFVCFDDMDYFRGFALHYPQDIHGSASKVHILHQELQLRCLPPVQTHRDARENRNSESISLLRVNVTT